MVPLKTSRDVLRSLTFGHRTAEEEKELLAAYFVETDQWRRVYAGDVDIVYGAKGAGKSALYFLLLDKRADLNRSGTELITAENPRGATVFKDLATEPPAAEREFIDLWKLYFLSLVARFVKSLGPSEAESGLLLTTLENIGVLEPAGGLKGLLRSVRDYVRRFSGVEGGLTYDPRTGSSGLSGKLLFQNPSRAQRENGAVSIDDLYSTADALLGNMGTTIWILLDRLDVAFAETASLEQNALRALFKSYLDLQDLNHIKLKIFLRSDIWSRITNDGFREASHITRNVTIEWNKSSLLNLIVRRSMQNADLRELYSVDEASVAKSADYQEALFYRMFPEQVDSGPNKPRTLEWLLSRTQDGSRETAPRELIHLLNSAREVQSKKLELGEATPPNNQLFSRPALKEALPGVSRVRLQQTLYAEYPKLKGFCEKLRGGKTQQSPESLATLWGTEREQTITTARSLVEIGFFEERGTRSEPEFWVPFLYRDSLEMSQGTATE